MEKKKEEKKKEKKKEKLKKRYCVLRGNFTNYKSIHPRLQQKQTNKYFSDSLDKDSSKPLTLKNAAQLKSITFLFNIFVE